MTQEQRVAEAIAAMKSYAQQSKTSRAATLQALHATGAYTTRGDLKKAASGNSSR